MLFLDEPFSHRSSLPSGAYDHSYAKRPKFSKDACIVDTDIAFSDNIAIAVDKPSSSTNVFCNHCNLLKLENRRLKNQVRLLFNLIFLTCPTF